jgi:hypothetical protein
MFVTCSAHLTLLDLITLIPFGEVTNYEAPHYVSFRDLYVTEVSSPLDSLGNHDIVSTRLAASPWV